MKQGGMLRLADPTLTELVKLDGSWKAVQRWTHTLTGDAVFTEEQLRVALIRALARWHRRRAPYHMRSPARWAYEEAIIGATQWMERDDPLQHISPASSTGKLLNHYLRR